MFNATEHQAVRKKQYRREGHWGNATLADFWHMSVLCFPEKIAVVDAYGATDTYESANRKANSIASFLKKAGIVPGDFVSFQLPGWAEFLPICMACFKIGAIANPLLPNFGLCELVYMLNKCESKLFFVPESFKNYRYSNMMDELPSQVPSLKNMVVVDKYKAYTGKLPSLNQIFRNPHIEEEFLERKQKADDVAAVIFTSGTESRPKGVMLTHNNIIAAERAFNTAFHINYNDAMLMPAPVAHATGFLHGVISPMMVGGKTVLQDIFDCRTSVDLMAEQACTYMMGATPFVHDILECLTENKQNIPSLRFFLCGGAPIPQSMKQHSLDLGIKLISVYGSTESTPHTATCVDEPLDNLLQTDGKALAGIEVRVVNEKRETLGPSCEGEEASRGPNVFVGYLKEPELTKSVLDDEGWYYSGDLCVMNPEGYIRITGRKKDVIVRGGENISATEVEKILLSHPDIQEAAVVAMPDPRLGEKACAYVVLKKPDSALTLSEVIKHFASWNVAKFKYPQRLELLNALPKTASGKIQKALLRKDICQKLKAELQMNQ